MHLRFLLLAAPALAGALGCQRAGQVSTPASVLPLRTLKLYETGVGYFERSGPLVRGETTTLPVPTGHLDDALKTLVVAGNANLTGVEFSSSLSRGMARALAGLPPSADEPLSYHALLSSLKGAEVVVKLRGPRAEAVRGRLIDVLETKPPVDAAPDKAPAPPQKPELTLLLVSKAGELRRLDTAAVAGIRPTDPSYLGRVDAALDALSVRAAQNQRALRVLAQGNAPVTLGYLAETPIWRTTYRLVMAEGGERGTLQGWALIHNDTEESWAKVRVELVNGQPDSFLFPLAAPRYGRRELATPEEQLATVPQLLDTTVDQIWGDNLDTGTVGHGAGTGTGYGYGSGHGRVGGSHATRSPAVRMGATVSSSAALSVGNLAAIAPAEGVEAGALFSYELAAPLDLRAHGSALVPFLAAPVTTRRITWFSGPDTPGRSAIRFTNATRQTLPAGPIALYEGGGFAGEAGLERLKPTERVFLQFGVDLDVELARVEVESKDQTRAVRFVEQTLEEDFFRDSERSYTLTNRARASRSVYVELGVVDNSTVEGADELDYDSAGKRPLAVFVAPPGKKLERRLKIREGLQRSTREAALSARTLSELGKLETLPLAERTPLKEAALRLEEAEAREQERDAARSAIEEVVKDLERLRQHLSALGDKSGPGQGAHPLVKRILDAEDKLTALRAKAKGLESAAAEKRLAARGALEKLPQKKPRE